MKAKVRYESCLYGLSFWEIDVVDEEKTHRVDVTVGSMKKLGVAKTLRSTKKLETWLNETEEGQKYLFEKVGKKVIA